MIFVFFIPVLLIFSSLFQIISIYIPGTFTFCETKEPTPRFTPRFKSCWEVRNWPICVIIADTFFCYTKNA